MFKQWSRLIAGTSLDSSRGSKNSSNHPEKRLARFKKEYSQLLVWGLHAFDSQNMGGTNGSCSKDGAVHPTWQMTMKQQRIFDAVSKTSRTSSVMSRDGLSHIRAFPSQLQSRYMSR
jgi:hypothetical protein